MRLISEPQLRVQVVDDEIIVTLPGYSYSVTYYKPAHQPQLIARRIADRDDLRIEMKLSEFLTKPGGLPTTRRENLAGLCEAGHR